MAAELTPDDVGKMKVAELRAELKARDLSTSGLKKELADRLLEHLSASGGATSNGAEATAGQTDAADAPAAPENGTDVPETAAPSGDSTAQTAGEAAPITATTEQAETDNLPSEMPVIPPVTEDSVDDFTGGEGTIAQETATEGVETANEPSEVVHPHPDHLDKIPGFVADSRVEEAKEKAEVVPLNEPAVLPGEDEASLKRKRDETEDPVVSAQTGVASVAEQEESSAPANDEITADPAAASILNGSAPEAKRPRTDEGNDIPVPQDSSSLAVEDITSMPVDANTNGASSSAFPTSVITPGIDSAPATTGGLSDTPDVVTLNEPQKFATDFATAGADEATSTAPAVGSVSGGSAGAEQETKSVNVLLSDTRNTSSSLSPSPFPAAAINNEPDTHCDDPAASNNEKRNDAQGEASTNTRSLDIRETSSTRPQSKSSLDINNQNSVAPSSSTVSPPTNNTTKPSTSTLSKSDEINNQNHSKRPPLSKSICISNLVRPFTLPALKSKLEDFGDLDYFWINSIKSHCFVTYTSTDIAAQVSQDLEGQIWPEAVGKPLSVTYIPSEKIPSLVEKEEAAGRTRLELVTTFDEESNEWKYDVLAPAGTSTGRTLGQAPPVPRGLASSLPLQARTGIASGRLDPRSMITATSASGASIQIPSNSAFAQSRPPASRDPISSAAPPVNPPDSGHPWAPKTGAEDLYAKTRTAPHLYYKAVDKVAAGRRLRQLEVASRGFERAPYNRGGGGRTAPSTAFRDSYRP